MQDSTVITTFVVDDNFHNRTIARIALESAGFVVEEADDSTEAYQTLTERTFDLLILDLQMPKLTGNTILHHISDQALHKNMKVIVMTANPHMADDSIHDKADFVMMKPFDVAEFQRLARKISQVSSKFSADNQP
jgi:CheY-like chemotaxis protein